MPKIKTHKASSKRFSITGSGKIKAGHSLRRHKLGTKTAKRRRQLRKAQYISESMIPTIKQCIQKFK